jgi:hypothetical protein
MLSLTDTLSGPPSLATGTYQPHQPVVRIQSFSPYIRVFSSKQRPRRLGMLGSDGRKYLFLLKGHEDLRQVRSEGGREGGGEEGVGSRSILTHGPTFSCFWETQEIIDVSCLSNLMEPFIL